MAYDRNALLAQLRIDEGLRTKPYRDTVGKLTIGIGRNLDDVGISEDEALTLAGHDLDRAETLLDRNFTGWRDFSDARQQAVLNLCFNMGWGDGTHGLSGFKNMLGAMLANDWDAAASDLLASRYATQVGQRAQRIATLLRNG